MHGKQEKQVKITTLIGQGAELEGDFSAKGSARIDGQINGDVTVTGTLIVGATGIISGNVTAISAVIGGAIQGNINVLEKAELTGTAKVLGDITTKVIVIDEHAVFQGKCDMNQEAPEGRSAKREIKKVRNVKKTAKAAIAEALREVKEEEAAEESRSEQKASEQKAAEQTPSEQMLPKLQEESIS